MKKMLYVALFISISYNLFTIGNYIYRELQFRRSFKETTISKNVTLEDGFNDFKHKFKTEYPNAKLSSKVYVGYLTNFLPEVLFEDFSPSKNIARFKGISIDSAETELKVSKDKIFLSIDSLASVYKAVTFVIAFQRTGKDVAKTIKEYKSKTKNVYYLNDMNLLYSGYRNFIDRNPGSMTVSFLLDSTGKMIYHTTHPSREISNKKLINALNEK